MLSTPSEPRRISGYSLVMGFRGHFQALSTNNKAPLMSDLDHLFKFKIGQTVRFVGEPNPDRKVLIVERTLQECPGGVQRHYKCRPYTTDLNESAFHSRLFELNEIELTDE